MEEGEVPTREGGHYICQRWVHGVDEVGVESMGTRKVRARPVTRSSSIRSVQVPAGGPRGTGFRSCTHHAARWTEISKHTLSRLLMTERWTKLRRNIDLVGVYSECIWVFVPRRAFVHVIQETTVGRR